MRESQAHSPKTSIRKHSREQNNTTKQHAMARLRSFSNDSISQAKSGTF